jgi:hypothetical protein
MCYIPTLNGKLASRAPNDSTPEVPVTCCIEPSANAAAADTGLPFPCALLLLFHLDIDKEKMWVGVCVPAR